MCFRPDEDTIRKIEARLKTLLVPHYFARINRSRGKKCGQSQWQKDHWNAVDATSRANKNGHDTITMSSTENRSWLTDGLRSTANIWITSGRLTWSTRPLVHKDTDTTKDKPTTSALIGLRQEQGRELSKMPKHEAKLERLSQNWRTSFAQSSSSSSSSQNWWQHEHDNQDSQCRGHQKHSTARSPMTRSPITRS